MLPRCLPSFHEARANETQLETVEPCRTAFPLGRGPVARRCGSAIGGLIAARVSEGNVITGSLPTRLQQHLNHGTLSSSEYEQGALRNRNGMRTLLQVQVNTIDLFFGGSVFFGVFF